MKKVLKPRGLIWVFGSNMLENLIDIVKDQFEDDYVEKKNQQTVINMQNIPWYKDNTL